jgi:long-chain acyl-CoA synthetase
VAVEERSTVTTRTIPALWRRAVSSGRTDPAYLVKRDGAWAEVSWEEAGARVDELAHGFLALGLKKGDAFAIFANTCLEWALVDFALAQIGVVVIPVYATSSPADCAYVLEHSEAIGVLCETDEMRERDGRLELEHMLTFADLDELAARGREHAAANPGAVEQIARTIGEDDVLTIVYTSGTTGRPKGCVMLHKNYAAVVGALEEIHLNRPGDTVLLFLPLAHTYAQLVLYDGAGLGFTIAFEPEIQGLPASLEQVRPTGLPSVPRVYEKVHAAITAKLDAATGLERTIGEWALAVGYRASRLRQEGRSLPPWQALQWRLADRLVYSKVKARLGGNLRAAVSGAAPIAVELLEFFHAMDVLILEGYGLTESASGCSVNREDRFRFGTVGPPLPGIEVRIAEDGEILIRGDNVFAGYYKDEAATREALDEEGWLHTGDVGELDEGFLRITDRKKDIIVTAGGKNVAPQNLENDLKRAPGISQALVVGDRRPYLVALVTVEPDVEEAEAAVQAAVDAVNRDRTRYEQIKRFAVLPEDFSAERGEVTPTMKLRRKVIVERFADEIERLYSG